MFDKERYLETITIVVVGTIMTLGKYRGQQQSNFRPMQAAVLVEVQGVPMEVAMDLMVDPVAEGLRNSRRGREEIIKKAVGCLL